MTSTPRSADESLLDGLRARSSYRFDSRASYARYLERDAPRLRARHMPFPIGVKERDQWLACMEQAMSETGVPEALRTRLADSFFQTADWMRNSPG